MPDINITVAHKVAVSDTQSIVCDNSDYMVHWTLDEEWSAYDTKTMRTIYMDGTYEDKVFRGNEIALPVCTVPGVVQIGLFAGDIRTSRVAILRALPSVRSAAGAPADPTPDVYDQLMERMAQLENPDWAQNDPAKKDYVKNRTHWAYSEEVTIVPEQVFKAENTDGAAGAILENFDRDLLCAMETGEFTATLHVVFDGAAYSTNTRVGEVGLVIGNLGLLGGAQDTGEPFVFVFQNRDGAARLAIICRTAGTHTVALTATEVVKTLDRKYMPAVFLNKTTGKKINLVNVYDQANADDWIDDTININLIPVFTDGGKLLQQLSDERSAFFTLKFKKSSSISISQGEWRTGELVDLPQNVKDYLRNVCTNPHYHVSCNLYTIDSSGNTSVHTCGVAFHTGSYKDSVLYGVGTYWDEQYLVHVKLDLSKSPPEIKWKGIRN